jgi:glutamate carboxypeptidase
VLVCEAARADGSLVKARKGMAGYHLTFSGVAAHAGNDPEKGRSAITALANSIIAINALTDWDRGTTLNVGVIRGGSAANVVADTAVAELDVRFWENDEYDRVNQALEALCEKGFSEGVTTTLTRVNHKPAMATSEATRALMQQVEAAGKAEGIAITWQAVGGGSDANHTAALGIRRSTAWGRLAPGSTARRSGWIRRRLHREFDCSSACRFNALALRLPGLRNPVGRVRAAATRQQC